MGKIGFGCMAALVAMQAGAAVAQTDIETLRRANGAILLQNYPRGSLARGEEGTVGIKVAIDREGRLRSCAVSKSSGFPALDRATCDLLIAHMKVRTYVAPGGSSRVYAQDGEIVWKLPENYTGPRAVPGKLLASADPDRKICKVQMKTGSLVGSQRVCLTRGEWQRQYDFAQEEGQNMKPRFQSGN